MDSPSTNTAQNLFKKNRIYWAVGFGLLVSGYLLWTEFSQGDFLDNLKRIHWNYKVFLWLLVAIGMMLGRDIGYVIRIKLLSEGQLNWRQSIRVIFMWEFASSVSPGMVGGSAVAMFILNREKISLGQSTAMVMVTTLLDNLFYIVFIPFILLLIGTQTILPETVRSFGLGIFWVAYGLMALLTLALGLGLFMFPQTIKRILYYIFQLNWLKKWKRKALKTGDDIVLASEHLKGKAWRFWIQLFLSTTLSWTSRFLVVNAIIMAFVALSGFENTVVFSRQLTMWLALILPTTPGGSGMAEYLFHSFLKDMVTNSSVLVLITFIWRFISYYPYLFIGLFLLPHWMKSTHENS